MRKRQLRSSPGCWSAAGEQLFCHSCCFCHGAAFAHKAPDGYAPAYFDSAANRDCNAVPDAYSFSDCDAGCHVL